MKRISNFLAWYNQQTTASDQAFTKAVIIGFFVGFGMVINLIPPEEIKKWDLNSLPFILLFGFTFWGIGFNLLAQLLSSALHGYLEWKYRKKVNQEKVFVLFVWSHIPFVLGILTGFTRMLHPSLIGSLFHFAFLWIGSIVLLLIQLKKGGADKWSFSPGPEFRKNPSKK
jgi:hypothetical protein